MSEQTFDPTRDPFDPRQERWKGWERDGTDTHTVDGNITIIHRDSRWAFSLYMYRGASSSLQYHGATLPHATVVSILLANGYEPEVEATP